MTEGYTSILYRTPDEDVGFWYNNLRQSLEELKTVTADATKLERSNLLMKLRETILDDGRDGVSVTIPPGMSRFPYNTGFCLWGWLSFILLAVCVIWALIAYDW